ncbi:MAG: transposase [Candidatus Shapirobacteria bacterium]|jgi:REP element-mobilizing transposase RayT
MDRFAEKYSTKSSRLFNYNYSSPGIYFITICTLRHNNFFGKIIDNKIKFTKMGIIAKDELLKTIIIRDNLTINPWVIMPNHIHLLITLPNTHVETPRGASLHKNQIFPPIIPSHKNHPEYFSRLNVKSNQEIPKLINQFKSRVTIICRENKLFFAWQPRYYDEIVKDQGRFKKIKTYIINNPLNWQKDKYYFNNLKNNL